MRPSQKSKIILLTLCFECVRAVTRREKVLVEKSFYSGTVLVLGLIQLIESIAFSIPVSYFPNYAISLGASVASIGLFTSSFMLMMAVLSPKVGSLSDTYGRKRFILMGLMGDVVLGTLSGLAPSWHWLLLIRVFNGAAAAAAMLPSEALLIDSVSPQRRGEASGFVMALAMIGRNIGPVFGGTIQWLGVSSGLSLVNSYRIPYFVDSVLAFLGVLLVAWRVQEPERRSQSRHSSMKDRAKVPLSPSIKVMLVAAFASGIGVGFIIPISVLFYSDKFGIQPVEIGLIISLTGLIGLTASWLSGRISDKVGRKPMIVLGGLTSRILGFALPLTERVEHAAAVLAGRSLGFNVMMPAMRALRADIVPAEARGRIFGLFAMAFTSGGVLGPIIGTYLYSIYRFKILNIGGLRIPGIGIPFFVNSIIGIITLLMLVLFIEEPNRVERPLTPQNP